MKNLSVQALEAASYRWVLTAKDSVDICWVLTLPFVRCSFSFRPRPTSDGQRSEPRTDASVDKINALSLTTVSPTLISRYIHEEDCDIVYICIPEHTIDTHIQENTKFHWSSWRTVITKKKTNHFHRNKIDLFSFNLHNKHKERNAVSLSFFNKTQVTHFGSMWFNGLTFIAKYPRINLNRYAKTI